MVFSSLEFIFLFLPAFFLIYGLCPKNSRNLVIFIGSVIFYTFGITENIIYLPLFLMIILCNYIVGQLIGKSRAHSKYWLTLGIIYNFWWLLFFKYSEFFIENLDIAFNMALPVRSITLPVGISFYTFQNVSYLADVYHKRSKAETSFINYGAYISMFPQLIAGPIVTYRTVAVSLKMRAHTPEKIDDGLRTFTMGLGYKVLIANQIGHLWNELNKIGFESISTPLAWMGILAYAFQLYFDFYGYSLMAVGLGKIMGFRFPDNFNHPYTAVSMTDFWKRWHITLSSWFRDYVYIPLGGNRKGTWKTIRNLLIVWLFTGFWHGASWNFILWGLVTFLFLILEKFFIGNYLETHRIIGHIYAIFVILITWVLFAITDFQQLGIFFAKLFPVVEVGKAFEGDYIRFFKSYWYHFLTAGFLSTPLPEKLLRQIKYPAISGMILLGIFWGSVYCMYQGMDDPFLYFRF